MKFIGFESSGAKSSKKDFMENSFIFFSSFIEEAVVRFVKDKNLSRHNEKREVLKGKRMIGFQLNTFSAPVAHLNFFWFSRKLERKRIFKS